MILFTMRVQELNRTIDEVNKGDILKRKQDQCYYELKDISFDKQEIAYYHFYGFTIRGMRNMKLYFENDLNKFEVYKEKLTI